MPDTITVALDGKAYTLTLEELASLYRVESDSMTEAAGTDHFYGAWRGGKASAGGGPAIMLGGHAGAAGDAADALARGKHPNVAREDVEPVVRSCADRTDHPDLLKLGVEGKQFGGAGLGYARHEMPVLSSTRLPDYLADLSARGIGISHESVAPRSLKPMQREVSATSVAKMMANPEAVFSKAAVVSSDGYVLDGHHRWGAAAALSYRDSAARLKVVRIAMTGRQLHADALAWNRAHGIEPKRFGEADSIEDGVEVTEADDDHFYGAWKGGGRALGGHPAGASFPPGHVEVGPAGATGRDLPPMLREGPMDTSTAKADKVALAAQPTLSAQEQQALDFYTGDGYGPINRSLRHDGDPTVALKGARFKRHADGSMTAGGATKTLDGAFARAKPLSEPVDVIRATRGGRGVLSSVRPGDVITDKGYVSATTSRMIAESRFTADRATSIVMKIHVPAGMRVLHVGADEHEVVLPHGTRFRVLDRGVYERVKWYNHFDWEGHEVYNQQYVVLEAIA
jgi:hypothetical protein